MYHSKEKDMKTKNFICRKCWKKFTERWSLQQHQLHIKCTRITRNKSTNWSQEDLEYLVKNYEWGSIDDIVKQLKRSWVSIQRKANLLYLIRKRHGDSNIIYIIDRYFSHYINKQGYMILWDKMFGGGYIMAHRYIWEKKHNKKIPNGYEIHHKDGNRINNEIENLELVNEKVHGIHGGINRLAKKCFTISDEHGFWDKDIQGKPSRNIPEALMLIVTELSEAIEAYRNGNIEYSDQTKDSMEEELADAIIRLLDLSYGLNLMVIL
jgi:NTP pyrophosphatase (non-canonical NTP hydrolase)